MSAANGVILIMISVLALYLIWAARSPLFTPKVLTSSVFSPPSTNVKPSPPERPELAPTKESPTLPSEGECYVQVAEGIWEAIPCAEDVAGPAQ